MQNPQGRRQEPNWDSEPARSMKRARRWPMLREEDALTRRARRVGGKRAGYVVITYGAAPGSLNLHAQVRRHASTRYFPRMDALTDTCVAIVGAGRMGKALAAAMIGAELRLIGPLTRGRTTKINGADIVLICVPDAAIAEVARAIDLGPLIGHCSGASTLAPLAPHEAFSMHPLMTVTGDAMVSFAGAGCAVAGSTERARNVANALARRLRMRPFAVAEADRDIYHAAASMASNYLVTIEGAAERLGALAEVDRELLVPLVRAAVENWARLGARKALTGPIARGDHETASRQRAAVESRAPELVDLWDALSRATRALARDMGT